LVLQTGGRDPEGSLGFYIMVPGVGLVRTPPPPALDAAAASRVGPPGGGAGELGGGSVMPYWMRVGIAVLCAAGVIFAFAFLGSSVVANRYYFQEVQTAPGRSVFYKVDRWTGEMTRCRTDMAAVGPVC
ncbi:MAG: hypothetical protein OXC00_14730, partial [Acidimicrobiaceae bacterium]|nr:hypothetical protein [Acidimicrobiaceae bacterium]